MINWWLFFFFTISCTSNRQQLIFTVNLNTRKYTKVAGHVCHHYDTRCVPSLWHKMCVIIITQDVCHHYDTRCVSSLWHKMCVIIMTQDVCHHYDTRCVSSLWHKMCVIIMTQDDASTWTCDKTWMSFTQCFIKMTEYWQWQTMDDTSTC